MAASLVPSVLELRVQPDGINDNVCSVTQKCSRLLEQCLEIDLLMEREWAENKLAEFTLWASGIGASAPETDKISLEARLRGRPALLAIFIRLLRMLMEFLQQCHQRSQNARPSSPLQHNSYWDDSSKSDADRTRRRRRRASTRDGEKRSRSSRSISPWSDSSLDSDSQSLHDPQLHPLADAMKSVDSTIDQLNNLSMAVRRTGNQLRLQKADSRFMASEHSDLEKFLMICFFADPSGVPGETPSGLNRLSAVQTRLINANLRRRNRFLYAQRHSLKLATRSRFHDDTIPRLVPEQKSVQPVPDLSTVGKARSDVVLPHIPGAGPGMDVSVPFDNSTATMVGSTIEQVRADCPMFDRDTQITSTVSKVNYPHPPKVRDGISAFKCPCCCQTLPRMFSQGNRWR